MAKKNKKRDDFILYSTDPDFEQDSGYEEATTLPPAEQHLKVQREKKGHGGKEVTIISGFTGSDDDLKALGKTIKKACGVGGTIKNNEIIIQGNHTDTIVEMLKKAKYKAKKSGG